MLSLNKGKQLTIVMHQLKNFQCLNYTILRDIASLDDLF